MSFISLSYHDIYYEKNVFAKVLKNTSPKGILIWHNNKAVCEPVLHWKFGIIDIDWPIKLEMMWTEKCEFNAEFNNRSIFIFWKSLKGI